MKPENPETGQRERFLSRWSRLKREDARAPQAPAVAGASPASASGVPSAAAASVVPGTPAASGADVVSSLPPIESLSIDSDFTPFLQPKVPDALRRAAVKKLFADPRFNVMDGLDVYIDDYSIPDPIPPEMMKMLEHARDLIDHPSDRLAREKAAAAAGTGDDTGAASAGPEAGAPPDAHDANGASGATDGQPEAPGVERMTNEPAAASTANLEPDEPAEAPGAGGATGVPAASREASRR